MPSNEELHQMLQVVREEVAQLRNEQRGRAELQRHIRLARKSGEAANGLQPIIFLDGDKSERATQWESAAELAEDELVVFEQDGLWFGVAGSKSGCICRVIALLEKEIEHSGNLSATFETGTTMEEEIANIKAVCKCQQVAMQACSWATGGQIPLPLTLSLSGIVLPSLYDPFDNRAEEQQQVVRSWINGTHVFGEDDWIGCFGTKSLYADPDSPSSSTRLAWINLYLQNSSGWQLEIYREVQPPAVTGWSHVEGYRLSGGGLDDNDPYNIAYVSGYTVTALQAQQNKILDVRSTTGTVEANGATDPSPPPPPPPLIAFDPAAGYGTFDGSDDHVTVPAMLAGTARSLSFRVRSTQSAASKYLADFNSPRCTFAWNNTAGQLAYFDGTSWHEFGDAPDDGEWHEVTFTVNGTTAKAYVDGDQLGTTKTVASQDLTGATGAIASDYTGAASNVDADIGRVCVYSAELSAVEAANMVDQDIPTSNLEAVYNLDDTYGTNVADGSGNGNDGTATDITPEDFWHPYTG